MAGIRSERYLQRSSKVILDGQVVDLNLPPLASRRIHRIAVALGSEDRVNIASRDFGKGFVHLMDCRSLDVLFTELDTMPDFLHYLRTKEEFMASGRFLIAGHEDDLLAYHIKEGRRFYDPDAVTAPDRPTMIVLMDELWEHFESRPEAIRRKEADRVSYLWDSVIEKFTDHSKKGDLSGNPEIETALRHMSRETRFGRRFLSHSFDDIIRTSAQGGTETRRTTSEITGVHYLFMARRPDLPRELRVRELDLRLRYLRLIEPEHSVIIGIATESADLTTPAPFAILTNPRRSFDLGCVEGSEPHPQDEEVLALGHKLGWFTKGRKVERDFDEFPKAPTGSASGTARGSKRSADRDRKNKRREQKKARRKNR